MSKTAKKGIIIIVLLTLCVIAFFGVVKALNKIEKSLYPQKYSDIVEKYAAEYGLDPLLVYTFIHTESRFEAQAKSGAAAIGLTQITSDTFDWIKSKIAREEDLTFESLYTPETSVRFGCYYISECLKRYEGDISTAAAAYHSGWGTVDKLLSGDNYKDNSRQLTEFPYEQMNLYVKKINKSYAQYKKLYSEE